MTGRDTATIDYDQRVSEAHLTASLWERYHTSSTVLGAESWFSKPRDRLLKSGRIKYKAGSGNAGKTKHADLVISKWSDIQPLTEESTIRVVEVKTAFDASTRGRLDDQLQLYCDSKMFSEICLAVPEPFGEKAQSFLETNHPRVGFLTVDTADMEPTLRRSSVAFELKKVPVVAGLPGNEYHFEL